MTTAAQRENLKGFGEHIAAVLLLGDDYTDDEYVEAVTTAREAGIGKAYATKMLGTDVDNLLLQASVDEGEALVRAAEADLRRRGIDPAKATYRQFADTLVEMSR